MNLIRSLLCYVTLTDCAMPPSPSLGADGRRQRKRKQKQLEQLDEMVRENNQEDEEELEEERGVFLCCSLSDQVFSPRISFSEGSISAAASTVRTDYADADDASPGSAGFEFCFHSNEFGELHTSDDNGDVVTGNKFDAISDVMGAGLNSERNALSCLSNDNDRYSAQLEFSSERYVDPQFNNRAIGMMTHGNCVNGKMASADELFMDGKIMPLVNMSFQSRSHNDGRSVVDKTEVSNRCPSAVLRVDPVACDLLLKPSSSKMSCSRFKDFCKAQLLCNRRVNSCRIPFPPKFSCSCTVNNSAVDTSSSIHALRNGRHSASESKNCASGVFQSNKLAMECSPGRAPVPAKQSVSSMSTVSVLVSTKGFSFESDASELEESMPPVITLTESIWKARGASRRTSGNTLHASQGFSHGSQGSRGAKLDHGQIILRNLDRYCGERKLGRDNWNGLGRRSTYPIGMTVMPVLNIAVYRGGKSKSGILGFGNLFSNHRN